MPKLVMILPNLLGNSLWVRMKRLGFSSLSDPVAPTSGPDAGGILVYLLDQDGKRVELIQKRD